jgi:hypothetical protein
MRAAAGQQRGGQRGENGVQKVFHANEAGHYHGGRILPEKRWLGASEMPPSF